MSLQARLLKCRRLTTMIKKASTFSRVNSNHCSVFSKNGASCQEIMTKSFLRKTISFQPKMSLHAASGNAVFAHGFHTSPCNNFYEDKETKTLAVWKNLRELRASPVPALSLGLAGLLPFLAAPAYMISQGSYMPEVAFAQLAYGASILSFLGGVRWGFVLPEESVVQPNWMNLGYSVAPSLIAWVGLMAPPLVGIMTVITGLGFSAYMDLAMYGYPSWFKGLRFLLSFFAILSLWSTFMCFIVMERERNETPVIIQEGLDKES